MIDIGPGRLLRSAAMALLVLTLVTGLAYPLAVTGIAQLALPHKAGGSLIRIGGSVVGSSLIGQPFDDPGYFWSRPSVTESFPYNAAASAASNLGPLNPSLLQQVRGRADSLRLADPDNSSPLPIDLVTSSASGLDPHISRAAAEWQVPRVARVRDLDESTVRRLVQEHTEGRQLGFLGTPRVNVLELNLALDALQVRQ
ncbi:MAG: potassium-transporting ATPase subunit KdpC [Thermoleophilia bacterium]|nr:potassium-transporting ATPase subunit KdpC [Thermoleophilia bacterium]